MRPAGDRSEREAGMERRRGKALAKPRFSRRLNGSARPIRIAPRHGDRALPTIGLDMDQPDASSQDARASF
jgi:hypothetical protein